MRFFDKDRGAINVWLPIITGPIVALIAFTLAYWIDPLSIRETKGAVALFVSILILMISQWLVTVTEMQKAAKYSDRLYEAIKSYLHVTSVGSPENALRYINERMPILREVQNTRLNLSEEDERLEEKLYTSDAFESLQKNISLFCKKDLIWKDIGCSKALPGFRELHCRCLSNKSAKGSRYKYRLLTHAEPQINFILLEYKGGEKEVLFNWDFRGVGQDPTVLVSRDQHIVEMFSIQFSMLWRSTVEDHDNQATKSTSIK